MPAIKLRLELCTNVKRKQLTTMQSTWTLSGVIQSYRRLCPLDSLRLSYGTAGNSELERGRQQAWARSHLPLEIRYS